MHTDRALERRLPTGLGRPHDFHGTCIMENCIWQLLHIFPNCLTGRDYELQNCASDSTVNVAEELHSFQRPCAFKIYDSSKGVRSSRIINWKTVECPKQPTNVECGFYVMKYMKDLIRDERILSRGNFNGKKTYTKAEIDEVRAEWIKSVMNEV